MHIALISVNNSLCGRDVWGKPRPHRVYSVDIVNCSAHDIFWNFFNKIKRYRRSQTNYCYFFYYRFSWQWPKNSYGWSSTWVHFIFVSFASSARRWGNPPFWRGGCLLICGSATAGNACGHSNTAEGSCHLATRRCRIKTGLCLAAGRLMEWVHNVGGPQISKGEIIITFIRKLTCV